MLVNKSYNEFIKNAKHNKHTIDITIIIKASLYSPLVRALRQTRRKNSIQPITRPTLPAIIRSGRRANPFRVGSFETRSINPSSCQRMVDERLR